MSKDMLAFLQRFFQSTFFATSRGFSLVELSIVLVIIAMVAGSALSVALNQDTPAKIQQSNAKLDEIERAIGSFIALNGRLPCPALGNLPTDDPAFGLENTSAGICTGNFSADGSMTQAGVVPVRTLQLPDEFMWDGWSHRISYVMSRRLGERASFRAYNPAMAGMGMLTVRDAAAQTLTATAGYVLISHGDDGYGGWYQDGGRMDWMNAASAQADEVENTHVNGDTSVAGYNSIFVQKIRNTTAQVMFDDIVRYRTKPQLVRMAGKSLSENGCDNARTVLRDNPVVVCRGSANDRCVNNLTALASTVNDLCLGN